MFRKLYQSNNAKTILKKSVAINKLKLLKIKNRKSLDTASFRGVSLFGCLFFLALALDGAQNSNTVTTHKLSDCVIKM